MPSEPWPASAHSAQGAPDLVRQYRWLPVSSIAFELKAPKGHASGSAGSLDAGIEVNLIDLTKCRGKIVVDLESLVMAPTEEASAEERTREAKNWLGLGVNRATEERERLRWATFTITRISEVSAAAPHAGSIVKRGKQPALAEEPGHNQSGDSSEIRAIRLTASGDLILNGFRVERSIRLQALFHYPVPATPGAEPSQIIIKTSRPLELSLTAHDIKPRDADGRLLSQQLKLIGTTIANEVRINADLIAVPRR